MRLGINPRQKHHPLFFAKPLLKSENCPSPLFRQSLTIYWFFVNPPKNRIFQWTPIILKLFILNPIYLLKVTKFLVKISQFKFLVMIEKNIFVRIKQVKILHNLFYSTNNSMANWSVKNILIYKTFFCHWIFQIFLYFSCKNYNPPPEKCRPLFHSSSPLKIETLSRSCQYLAPSLALSSHTISNLVLSCSLSVRIFYFHSFGIRFILL